MYRDLTVGVVIPAWNEEKSVGLVVSELIGLTGPEGNEVVHTVVVCDNASTDRTAQEAEKAGACVVREVFQGYGAACLAAIDALDDEVDVVLFVDADRSDYIPDALAILDEIAAGADLVIGSRALGDVEKGAMTPQQRFGNWLASRLIRILWGEFVTDLGPFRAIRIEALRRLEMVDRTYGWTVEMQVKAIQSGMEVREVPAQYRRRIGVSKISGTVRGTIGAGTKILGTIGSLWLRERTRSKTALGWALAGVLLGLLMLFGMVREPSSAMSDAGLRGIALGMHAGEDDYDYTPAIEEIDGLGAQGVELLIPYFQKDIRSSRPSPRANRTPTDAQIVATIKTARARGMDVFILPVVLLEEAGSKEWRGVMRPERPDEWWERYQALVVELAELAEQGGATGFAVGSELVWSEEKREQWAPVISAVRSRFSGKLIYSANWDHFKPVRFWDLLDGIGISGYFELTRDKDAGFGELTAAWAKERASLEDFSRKVGKPIYFTEVGYPALDGGAVHPWNYTMESESDEREQELALRAFAAAWQGSDLGGAFIYDWNLPDRPRGSYSPRDRSAEHFLRGWFAGNDSAAPEDPEVVLRGAEAGRR